MSLLTEFLNILGLGKLKFTGGELELLAHCQLHEIL